MKYKQTLRSFTQDDVNNRDLILQMLKYEDNYTRNQGQDIYRIYNQHTLEPGYAIIRHVLLHFGFFTTDDDVNIYRSIFKAYYRSATDYDKEVLDSVHYMKNNKCVYYTKPKLQIGMQIPDCNLLTTDNKSIQLQNIIDSVRPFNHLFLCAFSMS